MAINGVTISFAFLRSRSSDILSVLTMYASGALLSRALDCSLLATPQVNRQRPPCILNVIPVQTGIQSLHTWTPASAGVTTPLLTCGEQ